MKLAHRRTRWQIHEVFFHLKRPYSYWTRTFSMENRGCSTTADWCWRAITTGTSQWSISTRISRYIHMLHSRWHSHGRWKSNGIWWTRHAGASSSTKKSKPLCPQLYKCSNFRRNREHNKTDLYTHTHTYKRWFVHNTKGEKKNKKEPRGQGRENNPLHRKLHFFHTWNTSILSSPSILLSLFSNITENYYISTFKFGYIKNVE